MPAMRQPGGGFIFRSRAFPAQEKVNVARATLNQFSLGTEFFNLRAPRVF
jgi:hypothetical protein